MKNKILFFFLFAFVLVCGCLKHSTPIPVGLTATINKANWTAPQYYARLDSMVMPGVDTQRVLTITGIDGYAPSAGPVINKAIELLVSTNFALKPAVYTMSDTTSVAILTVRNVDTTYTDGTITITSLTAKNVAGYFNFANKTVTGQFNVPIQ